jgi:hypothetical protein
MDSKKIIEKLIKIAEKQQKIIEKLAQQAELTVGDPKASAAPTAPAATSLTPNPTAPKREADTILASLPVNLKPAVALLEVHGGTVSVKFKPGQATQQNYDAVKNLVQQLQTANKLPGQTYNVHVVE